MCGFCGEIRFDDLPVDLGALSRMNASMVPRGPDGHGAWQQGRIALGHRRLSIIDLSTHASQPMVDSELGLTVAFNGCIYNYKELRTELAAKGYRFFSDGDTEVVLKAFHAWGADCVQRFHGMFAFAVAERDSGRLTLVRDRLGIKPLYYALCGSKGRYALRLHAAGPACGWWYRHRHRPGGPAPLHAFPRRGAGPPYDPARGAQAAAGHDPGHRAGR